jgi:hypothetical protein
MRRGTLDVFFLYPDGLIGNLTLRMSIDDMVKNEVKMIVERRIEK